MVELLFIVRGDFDAAEAMLQRARRLGADTRARAIWNQESRGDLDAAWAEVVGPLNNFVAAPARVALKSRDPQRIAQALSPAIWPEAQRSPGDYPEAYAPATRSAPCTTSNCWSRPLVHTRTPGSPRSRLDALRTDPRFLALKDGYPGSSPGQPVPRREALHEAPVGADQGKI